LAVLAENGVAIERLDMEPFFMLSQSDVIEAHPLDETVGGLLIRQLSRQFAIPITEFYYDPLTKARRIRPDP
jgi:hypothetical protein